MAVIRQIKRRFFCYMSQIMMQCHWCEPPTFTLANLDFNFRFGKLIADARGVAQRQSVIFQRPLCAFEAD